MSSPISQDQATSPRFQRTWLVAIALVVWTMQIGLTCWLLVESDRQYRVAFKLSFEGFEWNGCLLRAFAHPFNISDNNPISPASATVCGDEVIVLFKKEEQYGLGESPFEPRELVRFNFKTGHVTSSTPPKGARYLLSDGQTLWFLPRFDYEDNDHVFLWNGIPSIIDLFDAKAIPRVFEYVNERWTETDRCALMIQPAVWQQQVACGIDQANGQTHLWVGRHDCFYFRHGMEFGSEDDYARFQEPFRESLYEIPEDQLRQLGWTRIKKIWLESQGAQDQEANLFRPLGYWFEDNQPFAIAENGSFPSDPRKFPWGPIFSLDDDFRTADIESLLTTGSKLHEVQIPNRWRVGKHSSVQYQFVNSHDGRKFLVCRHPDDGRMHLFEFADGQLKLITWRRSWVVWQACLDAITFISVVIVGPSLVLGVLARLRQRRSAFDVGTDFVMASVLRRGIARAIDLSLVVGFLALSIVLHPDVMTWWTDCILDMSETLDLLSDVSNYNWASRDWFATSVLDLTNDLLSVPFIPWLFISALILAALQIVWQARSGRTIGKRLVGIKVLRTTLRPCGYTRSLLREILLVIDSFCLVSWVPGVIAILSTRRGQRIGDYWADTIVVRDVRQIPSI